MLVTQRAIDSLGSTCPERRTTRLQPAWSAWWSVSSFGVFIAIPVMLWRRGGHANSMHPLEYPLIWFGLQAVELLVIVPVLLFWVPDPGVWPEALRIAGWLAALIGLTFFNYSLRRRFIPRDASDGSTDQLGSEG